MLDINEVAQNVYRIKVPVPINVDSVNLYLFDGVVPTLLDAGTYTPEVSEAVHEGMRLVGIKRLEQVLITHWHVDHAGGAAAFAKEGARIYIGARDYREWLSFVRGEGFTRFNEWAVHEWGVPEEEVSGMLKIYQRLQSLTALPENVGLLQPEQYVLAGDVRLRTVLTPGHTAGHLAFYNEGDRLLFSGDTLLPDQIPYPGIWEEEGVVVSGLPAYLNSLSTIEDLQAKYYLPAHGLPQENPNARCQAVREQLSHQMEKYNSAETVYLGAAHLGQRKPNPGVLFIQLHYVYGWEKLKKLEGTFSSFWK